MSEDGGRRPARRAASNQTAPVAGPGPRVRRRQPESSERRPSLLFAVLDGWVYFHGGFFFHLSFFCCWWGWFVFFFAFFSFCLFPSCVCVCSVFPARLGVGRVVSLALTFH